jgi:ubiquinone/menaquinone biosynthesis C-methylase UbiE
LSKLELPSNHADIAAAIHVIEHFYAWEAPEVLAEWLRVIKPGGKLILELPCMDKVLAHIYTCVKKSVPISKTMGWFVFWGDPKHRDPLMVHKWGYSRESIVETLQSVGFRDVAIEEPRYHFQMRDMRIVGFK